MSGSGDVELAQRLQTPIWQLSPDDPEFTARVRGLREVSRQLKIANSKGHGSVEVKQRIVERLVQDARGAEESRYIVRTLVQHLRIGAVKTTMLIALSRALMLSRPPSADFETREQKDLAKLKKEELAEIYSRNEEIVKACFGTRGRH